MPERSRSTEVEYHRRRARSERDVAYRSANAVAADAHMRLSVLHLQRALLLQAVDRGPLGNIHPFRTLASTECRTMPLPTRHGSLTVKPTSAVVRKQT
jgi:hypothetical protein